jgi:hypothetical protein
MGGEENAGAYERAAVALRELRYVPTLEARQLSLALYECLGTDDAGKLGVMVATTNRAEEILRDAHGFARHPT